MMHNMPHRRLHPLAPVVAIDCDGTLADYHAHFMWFAQLYLGEQLALDWSRTPNGEFSDALGLDKRVYQDIKLAYRQGGMKRCLPVFPGATDLVNSIRERGVAVWICTTRPYLRLDNIDPDTREWFRRNKMEPDGVIFGEHKYRDLHDITQDMGRQVICVLDDLPEQIEEADSIGFDTILMDGDHNRWWWQQTRNKGRAIVSSPMQAQRAIHRRIDGYYKLMEELRNG